MKLMLSAPERRKTQWQSLWEGTHPSPEADRLSQVSLLSAQTAGKAARVAQIDIQLHRVGQAEQNTRKIFLQVPSWVCPDTTPPCLRKARVWLLRALFVH